MTCLVKEKNQIQIVFCNDKQLFNSLIPAFIPQHVDQIVYQNGRHSIIYNIL